MNEEYNKLLKKYKHDSSELMSYQDALNFSKLSGDEPKILVPESASEYEIQYLSKIKSIVNTFIKKNHDYGSAVKQNYDNFESYGENEGLKYVFGRIAEKFHRLENLIYGKHDAKVKDESISDTLIDMANYAILAAVSFDEHHKLNCNIDDLMKKIKKTEPDDDSYDPAG